MARVSVSVVILSILAFVLYAFKHHVTDFVFGRRPDRLMSSYLAKKLGIEVSNNFHCARSVRLGNMSDGGWTICLDHMLQKLTSHQAVAELKTSLLHSDVDENVRQTIVQYLDKHSSPCLVYSFGICDDFSFDLSAEALGCEVFMFDPSLGLPQQDLSPHMHFYPFGLTGEQNFVLQPLGWTMRNLESIIIMLGHQNRDIDLLKIDIEGSEWGVLAGLIDSDWIRKGRVKQLMLEVHFRADGDFTSSNNHRAVPVETDAALLAKLSQHGYALFNFDENWRYSSYMRAQGELMYNCLELSFIFVGPSAVDGVVPPSAPPKPVLRKKI